MAEAGGFVCRNKQQGKKVNYSRHYQNIVLIGLASLAQKANASALKTRPWLIQIALM